VNLMIPRIALARIDAAAQRAGQSRSSFMVDAALNAVAAPAPAQPQVEAVFAPVPKQFGRAPKAAAKERRSARTAPRP
jgi:hypothetical protein